MTGRGLDSDTEERRNWSVKTAHVGEIAELEVSLSFKWAGYTVLDPVGHEQAYDLVAEKEGEFERVQVKSGRLDNGSIDVHVCSWRKDGSAREYGDDEIDLFGVYCPDLDETYIVPVEEAPKQNMRLRVDPGGINAKVRRASNYEAEQFLQGGLDAYTNGTGEDQ